MKCGYQTDSEIIKTWSLHQYQYHILPGMNGKLNDWSRNLRKLKNCICRFKWDSQWCHTEHTFRNIMQCHSTSNSHNTQGQKILQRTNTTYYNSYGMLHSNFCSHRSVFEDFQVYPQTLNIWPVLKYQFYLIGEVVSQVRFYCSSE